MKQKFRFFYLYMFTLFILSGCASSSDSMMAEKETAMATLSSTEISSEGSFISVDSTLDEGISDVGCPNEGSSDDSLSDISALGKNLSDGASHLRTLTVAFSGE